MESIKLDLRSRETRGYSAVVGPDLLQSPEKWLAPLDAKKAFLIVDARMKVPAARLEKKLRQLGWETAAIAIPAKETSKDLRKLFTIYGRMIAAGIDRQSVLVAFGGGVIGDIAGFVAGTYLRGIRWVGIPTTLLAQVDSSVGGKTGVNHPLGKNLIGVFHQPSLVLCDTTILDSLSARDRISGLGEIIKYGLIFDKRLFEFLAENHERVLRLEPAAIQRVVASSLKWKCLIVKQDERETRGLRKLLNFGHTLGHSLESATDYKRFRHGEAIVWGMRWATALSVVRGHLGSGVGEEIQSFLAALPVPALPKNLSTETLIANTKRDKKVKDGKVDYILLDRIGHATADRQVTRTDLLAAFKRVPR